MKLHNLCKIIRIVVHWCITNVKKIWAVINTITSLYLLKSSVSLILILPLTYEETESDISNNLFRIQQLVSVELGLELKFF